ncbi:MAG: GNAT family N-acetyltransferase [Vicinamibacterales bacterium]
MVPTQCAPLSHPAPIVDAGPRLAVRLAATAREVEQACRLRYQVFVQEPRVEPLYNASGIERDALDDACDHLVVADDARGLVVATYRMLPGTRAAHTPLYTESEFDLHGFRSQVPHTLELARSCVHRDYRDGSAARLLWEGMLRYYFSRPGLQYLIGCASLRAADVEDVSLLHSYFRRQPCGSNRFGIRPKPALRIEGLRDVGEVDPAVARAKLPTMIKAYLRIGGEVVPEPVYDPVFRTYDFCMIVPKALMPRAYQRKFGGR